jgi:hypothetical protein
MEFKSLMSTLATPCDPSGRRGKLVSVQRGIGVEWEIGVGSYFQLQARLIIVNMSSSMKNELTPILPYV